MVEPIETAIRRVQKQLSDVEWAGGDPRPLRALLAGLMAARDRGERWNIPF
jgi:hypothetical protein